MNALFSLWKKNGRVFHKNIISAILLSIILFTSCTPNAEKPLDLEKYTEPQETLSDKAYLDSIGSTWLTPETQYNLDTSNDSIDGIQKLNAGNLGMNLTYHNTLFFTTAGEHGTLYMYLDSTTGEVLYLCPDPLCSHTERDKCPYMTIDHVIPDNSTEFGKLFVSSTILSDEGHPLYDAISEYTNDGVLKRIYGKPNQKTEEGYSAHNSFHYFCVYNNYICFVERYDYTSSGKTVETQEFFRVIDGTTGEVVYTCDYEDINGQLINITDSNMLFADYTNKCYYITDLHMKNPRTIFTYTESASITYDSNTEEYFVYTTEPDDSGNIIGSIYVYDKNWNGYKLEMPSSQITFAVITQNYIYYVKLYDPVIFGTSIRSGSQTMDTTGGKIFRVKRINGEKTTVSEEELVFDGHGEIFHNGFNVIGDYIYLKYKDLHYEGDYVWWRLTGDVARIHLTENTIKWINLQ